MLDLLSRRWWLVLVRGVGSIAFGIVAFVWPAPALYALVLLYAAYAIVDGALSIATASGARRAAPGLRVWPLVVAGLALAAAGAVAFAWPGLTAASLLLVIGVAAVVRGVMEIVEAVRLRHEVDNEWALAAAGALSIAFGVMVLVRPGAGALALIWIIAIWAILVGVLYVALALRVRALRDRALARPAV
jgi:uncharacterized membrane protein HdeD (DUF308 family)